jgi:hypothetical protein
MSASQSVHVGAHGICPFVQSIGYVRYQCIGVVPHRMRMTNQGMSDTDIQFKNVTWITSGYPQDEPRYFKIQVLNTSKSDMDHI